jgi:hypothetical protein
VTAGPGEGLTFGMGTRTDQAPAEPGIYAWFVRTRPGTEDWDRAPDADGHDIGRERFLRFLHAGARPHGEERLQIRVSGRFGHRWEGSADPDREPAGDGTESAGSRNLSVVSQDASQRRRLLEAAHAVTPVFSPPLYIGATDRPLRVRLGEHMEALDQHTLRRVVGGSPMSQGSEDRDSDGSFAERAAAAELAPESLYYACLAVKPIPGESPEQLRRIVFSLEYYLNRCWRPTMGRL